MQAEKGADNNGGGNAAKVEGEEDEDDLIILSQGSEDAGDDVRGDVGEDGAEEKQEVETAEEGDSLPADAAAGPGLLEHGIQRPAAKPLRGPRQSVFKKLGPMEDTQVSFHWNKVRLRAPMLNCCSCASQWRNK